MNQRVWALVTVVAAVTVSSVAMKASMVSAADPTPKPVVIGELVSPPLEAAKLSYPGSYDHDPTVPLAEDKLPKPVKQLSDETGASRDVWLNDDGSRTVRVYPGPQNYQDTDGSWKPITATVADDPDRPGWVRTEGNSWIVRFGPLSSDGGIEWALGDHTVKISPEGANGAKPEILAAKDGESSTTVLYREVWPSVDLSYTVTRTGVKENVILKDPGAAALTKFRVDGLSVTRTKETAATGPSRGVEFVDASGEVLGSMPDPTVIDASGKVVDPDKVGAVTNAVKDGYSLSVNDEWFHGLDASVFPVTIDPSIQLFPVPTGVTSYRFSSGAWAGQCPGYYSPCPSVSPRVRLGAESGSTSWLGQMSFDWSAYTGASPPYQVEVAAMTFCACSSLVTPPTIKLYSGSSSYVSAPADVRGTGTLWSGSGTAGLATTYALVTSYFQSVFSAGHALIGLEADGPVDDYFPFLTLILGQPPAASTITYPALGATPAIVHTSRPTLTAATVSGGGVKYFFEVSNDSQPGKGAIGTSGWQSSPSWQVPTGTLVDGMSYYTRVYTSDVANYEIAATSPAVSFNSVPRRSTTQTATPPRPRTTRSAPPTSTTQERLAFSPNTPEQSPPPSKWAPDPTSHRSADSLASTPSKVAAQITTSTSTAIPLTRATTMGAAGAGRRHSALGAVCWVVSPPLWLLRRYSPLQRAGWSLPAKRLVSPRWH